jgi:hypothetical protein
MKIVRVGWDRVTERAGRWAGGEGRAALADSRVTGR